MYQFGLGAAVAICCVIGLIFLRFWRKSKDRLFLSFAISFWLLGVNWFALAVVREDEPHTTLYLVRLVAFAVLLAGIWDKNRVRPESKL
jgi:hypothetical protein